MNDDCSVEKSDPDNCLQKSGPSNDDCLTDDEETVGGSFGPLNNCSIEKFCTGEKQEAVGSTALHLATSYNQIESVKSMLDRGVEGINKANNYGVTALHIATFNGYFRIVKLLIEKKADPNAKTNIGMTALHCAAFKGHTPIVKFLLEKGAHINALNDFRRTALYYAVTIGHMKTVQVFIKNDANINIKDIYGQTPLHSAAYKSKYDIYHYLRRHGAIKYADDNNFTPDYIYCNMKRIKPNI